MKKPNVLLLMTDEHTAGVAGFAGDSVAGTNHLDRLAERSLRFPNASCTCPICTPSRMSMLTGKDAHHCSAWNNHWVLFPEHKTWPGHLAEHGYTTALVGKMHFGGANQMNGFQHRPYGDLRHGLGHQPEPLSLFPGYNNPESAGITEIPESLIQDVVVSREALAFLREHADNEPDEPWFLCASYGRPHSPLTAPGRYIRRYRNKVAPPTPGVEAGDLLEPFAQRLRFDLTDEQTTCAREAYYACVDFVDDCIGELLEGLATDGLLENTIVIYTADHGEMLGRYGCWGKQLYYDSSSGVPLLIAGPGIAEGQTVPHPISLMDLFPTVCGLTGVPLPDGLDGVDFSGVLRSPQTSASPRDFAPSACYRYGVRIGYNEFADNEPQAAWRSVRDCNWKYVEVEGGDTLLFNLLDDPDETMNLAKEPEHSERCKRMREALYYDFSWDDVHRNLAADRERLPRYLSGLPPSMPNQYQLPDGRTFDAEKSLYDARWLHIPSGCTGGIIPQQFG